MLKEFVYCDVCSVVLICNKMQKQILMIEVIWFFSRMAKLNLLQATNFLNPNTYLQRSLY